MEIGVFSKAGEECLHGDALTSLDEVYLFNDCAMLLDAKYVLAAEPALNWSADLPMTEWEGVSIGGSPPRVTRIRLFDRGLKGEVPAELGHLWGLEALDLGGNRLTGGMPHFGNSRDLKNLYLESNRISGEIQRSWGPESKLEDLYLAENKLSGEIPSELGDMEDLSGLWLGHNRLVWEIPPALGELDNLEILSLAHNRLTGEIPAELAERPDMDELYLPGNYLSGCIPNGLRQVRDNDFDQLGLPFCLPPFSEACIEPLPSVSAITLRAAATCLPGITHYRWMSRLYWGSGFLQGTGATCSSVKVKAGMVATSERLAIPRTSSTRW